ncbi:YppF family protein [Bacillus spongiae]|uniref:YppF family protein n=1 Tax=Bacillus spongiae TaxID=2683610 RepID=A0ABU8HD87_9BACI
MVNVQELKERFIQRRQYHTENVNDLLDFTKNIYISNEITLKDYSMLIQELEQNGALIPFDHDTSNIKKF